VCRCCAYALKLKMLSAIPPGAGSHLPYGGWVPDGYGKAALRDRAVPDFMAPLALADEGTSCCAQQAQQAPQFAIELLSHLRCSWLGFM
jgi:hypothetical protein